MNYWIKGGLIGVVAMLLFSLILTPLICQSIEEENSEVSCSVNDNLRVFENIYKNPWSILLLILGIFLGAFVERLRSLVKENDNKLWSIERKVLKKRRFLWMWER